MPLSKHESFTAPSPEIRRSPVDPSAEAGPSGAPRNAPAFYYLAIIGLLVLARLIYERLGKPVED